MRPGHIDHFNNVNYCMALWMGSVDPGGVELQSVQYCRRAGLETLGDPNEHGSSLLLYCTIHCYARACNALRPAPPGDLDGVPVLVAPAALSSRNGNTRETSSERGESANGRAERFHACDSSRKGWLTMANRLVGVKKVKSGTRGEV
jgi:hypothetical protein